MKQMKIYVMDSDISELISQLDYYPNNHLILKFINHSFLSFNDVKSHPNELRHSCCKYIDSLIEDINYPELQKLANFLS